MDCAMMVVRYARTDQRRTNRVRCLFSTIVISTAPTTMGKAEVGAKLRYLMFLSQRRGLSLRREKVSVTSIRYFRCL
jgi:hypothetical protein